MLTRPTRKPSNFVLLGAIGILLCSLRAVATEPSDDPRPAVDPQEWIERIEAELDATESRPVWVLGTRASYPQGATFAVGRLGGRQPTSFRCINVCDFQGSFVQFEPGLGGGKLGVGWARLVAGFEDRTRRLSRVYVGGSVKATLLRTWGTATLRPRDQTFAGVEGELAVSQFSMTLGVLRRISSGTDDDWLVTIGAGYGF